MTETDSLALSIRSWRWPLPEWVGTAAYSLSETAGGVGVGFLAGWVIVQFGALGLLSVAFLIACHEIAWLDTFEKDTAISYFLAYSILPMVAGFLVFVGLFQYAALVLVADYAMFFHESPSPFEDDQKEE